MREVRTALLEADVNFNVVQEFMQRVNERAVGTELIKSVRPDQQIVKIVHDELVELMGPVDPSIRYEKSGPTILMLCGLQGSGKTTTCGKLARLLAAQGRKPLLVAADLQRPAAVEQLEVIGQQLGVPVYSAVGSNPVKVCQDAVAEANRQGRDTIILDTAGRLHVDEELMAELTQIEKKVKPHQVYFVCDALTGQDAVASAGAFNKALELDGVIMTKLDGDARGGAALSVRKVTGVPIKFVGKGEKLDKLESFDPERVVGQMLGMGDIVGLVEAAQSVVDQEEAKRQQEKLAQGKFDLNDFRQQIIQMKKMGSVKELMGKIPGLNQMPVNLDDIDADGEVQRIQGIIDSMTRGRAEESASDRHLTASADRRRQRGRSVGRVEPGQAVRRDGRPGQADVADEYARQDPRHDRPGPRRRVQPGGPADGPQAGDGQAALAQGAGEASASNARRKNARSVASNATRGAMTPGHPPSGRASQETTEEAVLPIERG